MIYLDSTDQRYRSVQKQQVQLVDDYLKHWFSPWTGKYRIKTDDELKQKEQEIIDEFIQNPGLNENRAPHSQLWLKGIIENSNLPAFPNLNMKAITIRNAIMRELPSRVPSFESFKKAGQWYPFDRLQASLIAANTPIFVLHTSRDGVWYLVITPHCFGWLSNNDVAFVDQKFIAQWQTGRYVMATKDDIPVFDDQFHLRLRTREGILYPLFKTTKYYRKVFVAVATKNRYAVIKTANLRKSQARKFPIKILPKNIATLANTMIGRPYGWGDLYEYRDCSATLMDLFAPFGIWLPRNSTEQIKTRKHIITLSGLSNEEKERIVIDKGIPFLTLIHAPGHIMLYIGQYNSQPYIFHTMWGLRIKDILGRKRRAVIGRTIITPLRLGTEYVNVYQRYLDVTDSMAILGD